MSPGLDEDKSRAHVWGEFLEQIGNELDRKIVIFYLESKFELFTKEKVQLASGLVSSINGHIFPMFQKLKFHLPQKNSYILHSPYVLLPRRKEANQKGFIISKNETCFLFLSRIFIYSRGVEI